MKIRDAIERLLWTFVAAAGGILTGSALLSLDIDVWQTAALAGLGAVINSLTLIARWRLSVLPDPGSHLSPPSPAIPTSGYVIVAEGPELVNVPPGDGDRRA